MPINEDKLAALEAAARLLEPSQATRQQWQQQVNTYADAFVEELPRSKTYFADHDQGKAFRALPIAEGGRPLEEVLQAIDASITQTGINPAGGGHLGYVPGGGVFPAAFGDYLAAVTNRYAGIFFANPGAVRMENDLLRWMCTLIGYPASALGNLTSGGSIANLIAITTARDKMNIKAREVERAVIYLSEQVHHCVQKALRIAGLGESIIRYIPLDDHYRLNPAILEATIIADKQQGLRPFMVVGSAGTTDTGAIDPLDAMASIATQYGLWFHVDAAYGGFFLLVTALRAKFAGIERADSVAIDPHKGLFIPYGIGAILLRDVKALWESQHYAANYMQDALGASEELSPADLSPELTKHFRGLRMWMALQLLGLAPFRAALEEKILLCQYFYEKIQTAGFEVGPYPELSIHIFRYIPAQGDADAFNENLVQYIQRDGRVFLSSTRIEGVFWIRLAVLSFRTHRQEIDLALDLLSQGVYHLQKPKGQYP